MIWTVVQVLLGAACMGSVFLIDTLVRRWGRWRTRAKFDQLTSRMDDRG